jgi:hypothetical protein
MHIKSQKKNNSMHGVSLSASSNMIIEAKWLFLLVPCMRQGYPPYPRLSLKDEDWVNPQRNQFQAWLGEVPGPAPCFECCLAHTKSGLQNLPRVVSTLRSGSLRHWGLVPPCGRHPYSSKPTRCLSTGTSVGAPWLGHNPVEMSNTRLSEWHVRGAGRASGEAGW